MKNILYWEAIWWAGPQGSMLYDTEESAPTTGEGLIKTWKKKKKKKDLEVWGKDEAVECVPSK